MGKPQDCRHLPIGDRVIKQIPKNCIKRAATKHYIWHICKQKENEVAPLWGTCLLQMELHFAYERKEKERKKEIKNKRNKWTDKEE